MGVYVNPPSDTDPHEKKDKILAIGVVVDAATFRAHKPGDGGRYGVAIANNGPFTAAGVAFDLREVDGFTIHDDGRRDITYVLVEESKLVELDPKVANGLKYYLGEADQIP